MGVPDADDNNIPLHALAQILQAAPNLTTIKCPEDSEQLIFIRCEMDANTAADLTVLGSRKDRELVTSLSLYFEDLSKGNDNVTFHNLPTMNGYTRCQIDYSKPGLLGPLLTALPDLQTLYLTDAQGLDDIGLCAVAVGGQLQKITLTFCNHITPVGIFALCQRLTMLGSLKYYKCALLENDAMERVQRLLEHHGRDVKIVNERW